MNLISIIDQVSKEKGIDRDVLKGVLESAICSASRKSLNIREENIDSSIDDETGEISVYLIKKVVKRVKDSHFEINLKAAKEINPEAVVDEDIKILQEAGGLGRISAQLAKQVIIQKVREAERESIYNEYKDKKGEVVNVIVTRIDKGNILCDLDGKTEAILPKQEQAQREKFQRGDMLKTLIFDVKRKSKTPQIVLSRTHPGLLISLFKIEVPEISENIIEIKNAVREPNGRSKIAVHSHDKGVDAVGACVGVRGVRVQSVVQELRGEKIDIVEWSEEATAYVENALKPAKISNISLNHTQHSMEVVVPKDQLSLAIGKNGQNVRLAARLTGWKIDIKNEDELKKELGLKLNSSNEEKDDTEDTQDASLALNAVANETTTDNNEA